MKIKTKPCSIALASIFLILSLILISSTASASTVQNPSSTEPCAYIPNWMDGTVSVIDTVTNTVIATVEVGDNPVGAAVSPDGKKVYVTNSGSYYGNRTVSVIDTATNTVTATISVDYNPFGVAFSPDGKKVYVANSWDNNVSVIDTAENNITATVPVGNGPSNVAVSPDGTKVYVPNSGSHNISVIDTTTNTVEASVLLGGYPLGVAVSPDGTKVYATDTISGMEDGNVYVIDTATNKVANMVKVERRPDGIAVSPDGTKVYVTGTSDFDIENSTVFVIDTFTNKIAEKVNVGRQSVGVAVTPDGTKVYVTNWGSDTVSVIDTATNTVTAVKVGIFPLGYGQFIAPHPPAIADFTSNVTQGSAPLFVQFTDLSENATGWDWSFGDGNNSTEQNPMHEYMAPGNYTVILTASNGNGTDSKSATINVFEKPTLPVANFSTNVSEGFAPLSVHFYDSFENATSVNWDFGDGNNSTERNPIHEFTLPGNYTVNLTVANENGTDSKSDTINVIGKSAVLPAANFSSNVTTGNAPLSIQFTDLSTKTTEWNWRFGDGANSEEQNPMHTYSIAGNYTVILTANNSEGSNTVTKYSYITVVKPDETIIEGHVPLSVQFTDLSEGATAWNWNFGDGNTSTEQNPTHTYNETGQYTVTLTANNMAGSNVITKNSYIIVTSSKEAPVADFSVSTNSGKAPLNISFMDKSTGSPDSWNWDFGDGNVSTEQNTMHTYSSAGNYTVTLTVNNSAGSSAVTKYRYIIVVNSLKAPIADFSASTISGEKPLQVSN